MDMITYRHLFNSQRFLYLNWKINEKISSQHNWFAALWIESIWTHAKMVKVNSLHVFTINFYGILSKFQVLSKAKHCSTFTPFSLFHYSLWKSLSFIGLYKLHLSTEYSYMLLWQPLVFNFIMNFDTLRNVPSNLWSYQRISPLC